MKMDMRMKASKSDPPVGAIIVYKIVGQSLDVQWGNETSLDAGNGIVLSSSSSIIR